MCCQSSTKRLSNNIPVPQETPTFDPLYSSPTEQHTSNPSLIGDGFILQRPRRVMRLPSCSPRARKTSATRPMGLETTLRSCCEMSHVVSGMARCEVNCSRGETMGSKPRRRSYRRICPICNIVQETLGKSSIAVRCPCRFRPLISPKVVSKSPYA